MLHSTKNVYQYAKNLLIQIRFLNEMIYENKPRIVVIDYNLVFYKMIGN